MKKKKVPTKAQTMIPDTAAAKYTKTIMGHDFEMELNKALETLDFRSFLDWMMYKMPGDSTKGKYGRPTTIDVRMFRMTGIWKCEMLAVF